MTNADANALGECFVAKSTGEDRTALVRWMAGAILSSSKTADLAQVDPRKVEEANRQVAAIFTRLFIKDCLPQALAVKKSGNAKAGFEIAGAALGKIAMQEVFLDPAAGAALENFTRFIPQDAFKALEGK